MASSILKQIVRTRLYSTSPPPVLPHLRTATGRLYEHQAIKFMTTAPSDPQPGLGIGQVVHTGLRASRDGGVDARGWWDLPRVGSIRVLVQCKDARAELRMVRELEGVINQSPNVLGIFFASRGFTRPALTRAQASALPILLLHLPSSRLAPFKESSHHFSLLSAYANPVAAALLAPLSFVCAYAESNSGRLQRTPVLWHADHGPWKGP